MTTPVLLETLALAVADGAPIDWAGVLDRVGEPAELDALRLIEAIAAGHRMDTDPDDAA